jgi:hypothetical protein
VIMTSTNSESNDMSTASSVPEGCGRWGADETAIRSRGGGVAETVRMQFNPAVPEMIESEAAESWTETAGRTPKITPLLLTALLTTGRASATCRTQPPQHAIPSGIPSSDSTIRDDSIPSLRNDPNLPSGSIHASFLQRRYNMNRPTDATSGDGDFLATPGTHGAGKKSTVPWEPARAAQPKPR